MSVQNNDSTQGNHIFLTRFVRKVNPFINFIFYSIVLATILDIIANVISQPLQFPFAWKAKLQFMFGWGMNNWHIVLAIFAVLFIFKYTFSKLEGVEIPDSLKALEHKYLEFVEKETEKSALEGLPINVPGYSALLSAIFTFPKFHPNVYMTNFLPEDNRLAADQLQKKLKMWRYFPYDETKRVEFAFLWKRLTRERPLAVVLGDPGMGKSTLLAGLTLHMAMRRQRSLQYNIDQVFTRLGLIRFVPLFLRNHGENGLSVFQNIHLSLPLLVPILLNLRDYAAYIKEGHIDATIHNFIKDFPDNFYFFLKNCLNRGHCIVLFDGLDEVSQDIRIRIQTDIKKFIREFSKKRTIDFNRFILTSRNAFFDHNAFHDAECSFYTIAPLDNEQMKELLKKYYCAFIMNNPDFPQTEQEIIYEALESASNLDDVIMNDSRITNLKNVKKRAEELHAKISDDSRIINLAANPLMLYLLAVVVSHEESVHLPQMRIDLFREATKLLLEGHNKRRNLPPVEEALTIECLGPIAVKMLEEDLQFIHHDEVVRLVMRSMRTNNEFEAEDFLHRISERSGLFSPFINDYTFYHDTFKQYFAARHLIRNINKISARNRCIENLINKGCSANNSLREVFLLAVAYQSGKNANIANKILEGLYDRIVNMESEDRGGIIELAIRCLKEVKPYTLKDALTNKITKLYEQSHKEA